MTPLTVGGDCSWRFSETAHTVVHENPRAASGEAAFLRRRGSKFGTEYRKSIK